MMGRQHWSQSPLSTRDLLYLFKSTLYKFIKSRYNLFRGWYQTLPLGSKRFHFSQNRSKSTFIFIWFLSEKRTQKDWKEKGTSPASLLAILDNPPTIYWTYQRFCTIKKQVAFMGNQHWFKEVKVSIGNNKSIIQ